MNHTATPCQTQGGGKLRRLDIQGTRVTGPDLVESLNAVRGNVRGKVCLQELSISGDLMNELLHKKLATAIDESSLKHIKIYHANGLMTTMDKQDTESTNANE